MNPPTSASCSRHYCRQANSDALKPVEAQYAGASAKLPKADQDRYKRMLSAIRTGGSTLADCRGKTPKIAELKQALAGMVAFAALPVFKIGDRRWAESSFM